jgi:hypothetical protein
MPPDKNWDKEVRGKNGRGKVGMEGEGSSAVRTGAD